MGKVKKVKTPRKIIIEHRKICKSKNASETKNRKNVVVSSNIDIGDMGKVKKVETPRKIII